MPKTKKNPFQDQTVVFVKPDGVKRGIVGDIVTRFERVGFKIIALKMVWVDRDHIGKHYKNEKEYLTSIGERSLEDYKKYGFDPGESLGTKSAYKIGQKVRKWNMDTIASGPVVVMLLEGTNAIEIVRKMTGSTNTTEAAVGTIRGDFSADTPVLATLQNRPIMTIIHSSGNKEEAEFERKLWFKESEIYNY